MQPQFKGLNMWIVRKSKRARPGDIGRMKVDDNSWAKLHFLGHHESLGPAVLIDPNLLNSNGDVKCGNLLKSYVAFFLFADFVKEGLVEIVDHLLPLQPVPLTTRGPQIIGNSPCKSWIIFDSDGQRTVRDILTDDEIAIPVRMIISHDLLLDRLRTRWQPSDDIVYD